MDKRAHIYFLTHSVPLSFLSKLIQVQQPVQNVAMHRCVVMQNYGYLGQLSLALLFTCDKQFTK